MNLYGMADSEEIIQWIEERGVKPLFLCITGSHMWGLNRPDSDLDIRGIYADPVDKLLSLHPGKDNIEALGICGKDIDIQLYELKKAFGMLLNHNGNVVEMLLSPTCFFDADPLLSLPFLANKFLTKKLANYYRGYFHSQRKRAAQNRGGKSLLYSYREIMAGIVLMRTGRIIYPFFDLKREFETTFGWHSVLLDRFIQREDWKQPVSMDRLNDFEIEWEGLCRMLDDELERSPLPETYDGYNELNELLHIFRYAEM